MKPRYALLSQTCLGLFLTLLLFISTARAELSVEQQAAIEALSDPLSIAAYEQSIASTYESALERGIALRLLGYRWEAVNQMAQARQAFDASVRILETLPASAELVYSLSDRSYAIYTLSGDTEQYCPDRERALAVARDLGDAEPIVHALVRRAFCFAEPQNLQSGLADLQDAMDIAMDSALEKSTLSMIANASGMLYRSNQLHDRAYSAFEEAYKIWHAAGDTRDSFNMLHNMVGEAIQVGRWEDASLSVKQMFEIAADHEEGNDYRFFAFYNKGRLALASSSYEEAEQAFSAALELRESTAEQHFVAETYLRRAASRVWLGRFNSAAQDLQAFQDSGQATNADYDLYSRLNQAWRSGDIAGVVAVMLELRKLDAQKRYAFLDANTRLFTDEHDERIAQYEASLLKQKLALRELELERADNQARLSRQSIWNLGLAAIALTGLALWLFYMLRLHRARSHTDYLTGIANRGRVFERGFRMRDRAVKRGEPLAVILFDIDRFKRINDTLGHEAGDRVIRATVQSVKSIMGKGELLGRLGGEEFIAIVPRCDRSCALHRAEQMRLAVETANFVYADKHPVSFTISIGVACLEAEEAFQHLVNAADQALYTAKNTGRNRVALAEGVLTLASGQIGAVGSRQLDRADT